MSPDAEKLMAVIADVLAAAEVLKLDSYTARILGAIPEPYRKLVQARRLRREADEEIAAASRKVARAARLEQEAANMLTPAPPSPPQAADA